MAQLVVATPLILNSLLAFVPAAITMALTILRTTLEDRTLRLELDGYAHYTCRVKYRLVLAVQ